LRHRLKLNVQTAQLIDQGRAARGIFEEESPAAGVERLSFDRTETLHGAKSARFKGSGNVIYELRCSIGEVDGPRERRTVCSGRKAGFVDQEHFDFGKRREVDVDQRQFISSKFGLLNVASAALA